MNVIQDAAALYSFLQNVTGASGQVSYVHEITGLSSMHGGLKRYENL